MTRMRNVGNHYVSQKYLRGFAVPSKPDLIWMYDKKLGSRKMLPIKRVAQEQASTQTPSRLL